MENRRVNINNNTQRRIVTRTAAILCVMVWGIGATSAQTTITDETKSVVLKKGLAIGGIGQYGRSPVYQDAIAEQIITGSWSEPKAGDTIESAEGTQRVRPGSRTSHTFNCLSC